MNLPHPPSSPVATPAGAGGRVRRWLKRLGFAGFLFFTVKGLVWLGVFAAAAFGLLKAGG